MATRNQINPVGLKTISNFKNILTGGGTRSNLFEVVLSFPSAIAIEGKDTVVEKSRFLVKAAAIPASTISYIDVGFRGRNLKVASDRTFESWTITVINDVDFSIRSAFEKWQNALSKVSDATGLTNPADYQSDAFVHQLDRDGSILRTYHMYDAFPTNLAPIPLSSDQGAIEEFSVELQFLWWEAIKGDSSSAGGEDIN
jgi:hypothetical protein